MVMVSKRAVILKIYYMPNGLASPIHKKNQPNCQGCWGRCTNDPRKKLLKFFKKRPSKLKKVNSQDLVKQTVEANAVIITLSAQGPTLDGRI